MRLQSIIPDPELNRTIRVYVCQLSCHCKGLPQTEHQRSIGRVDDKQIPGQEDLSDAGHRRGTGINETLFQTLDMTDEYCGCVDFK